MSKTLVDIKDDLLARARSLTGIKKKVEIVNLALERLIKQKEIEKVLSLKGKIHFYPDRTTGALPPSTKF
jgi:Arc/MetJ family transcription regulator